MFFATLVGALIGSLWGLRLRVVKGREGAREFAFGPHMVAGAQLVLGELDRESGFTAERWRSEFEPYFALHPRIEIGPDARGPKMIDIVEERERWLVRQVLDDPAGDHDWVITAEVDLAASDDAGEAVVWITGLTDRP